MRGGQRLLDVAGHRLPDVAGQRLLDVAGQRLPDMALVSGATGSLVELSAGDLFVALPFVNGDAHGRVAQALSCGAGLALVEEAWAGLRELPPGLRARCMIVPDVVAAFRRLAAMFRARLSCPVVAIAGSNGKTTTKEMLAAMLSSPGRKVVRTPGTDNGFLGLPQTLCARGLRADAPADAVVVEIGIDAPLAMEQHARMVAPDVSVITALGPEHLGGLGDLATAVREELALLDVCPGARRVLPLDDPEIAARPSLLRPGDVAVVEGASLSSVPVRAARGAGALLFQARSAGGESAVEMSFFEGEGCSPGGRRGVPAFEIVCPLPGRHNARNLALAAAAALVLRRSPEEIREGWRAFEAPEARSRVAPLARGALLYDDCFNASPLSMAAALDTICDPAWAARPKVVVLGDMLDLGGESARWHLDVAERLARMQGVRVCLFGPAMGAVARRLRAAGSGAEVTGHLEEGDPAALIAGLDLPENAVVLVKGSRGMRMERVASHLAQRWARTDVRGASPAQGSDEAAIEAGAREAAVGARAGGRWSGGAVSAAVTALVAVAGAGRESVSTALAAALGCPGAVAAGEGVPGIDLAAPAAAGGGALAVVSLRHEDLLRVAEGCSQGGSRTRLAAMVVAGIDAGDLPPGVDVETHLAHLAQLLVRGNPPRALVIPTEDTACELLAEVAPPETRVLRYGGAPADDLEEGARQVLAALGPGAGLLRSSTGA